VLLLCACGGKQKTERWIAWSANLGEEPNIWIARADGSGRRLFERRAYAPAVSPDGRWIAYVGCIEPNICLHGMGPFGLHVRRTDGRGRRLLARGHVTATWSPRSDRLAVDRAHDLVSIDLASGRVTVIDRGGFLGFDFGPDGRLVYARSEKLKPIFCGEGIDLYVHDRTSTRRLTRNGHNALPVWGPDGIAFAHWRRQCPPPMELWLMHADGTGAHRLARLRERALVPVEWRDGALLADAPTEFSGTAVRVDPVTGARTEIGPSRAIPLGLSRDGRLVLFQTGGAEPPYTIGWVPLTGGRKHVVTRGDVGWASWNR
jgi:hypothetical protein